MNLGLLASEVFCHYVFVYSKNKIFLTFRKWKLSPLYFPSADIKITKAFQILASTLSVPQSPLQENGAINSFYPIRVLLGLRGNTCKVLRTVPAYWNLSINASATIVITVIATIIIHIWIKCYPCTQCADKAAVPIVLCHSLLFATALPYPACQFPLTLPSVSDYINFSLTSLRCYNFNKYKL